MSQAMKQQDRREQALANVLKVSADDRISECFTTWSLNVPHLEITRCITESCREILNASRPVIKIGSRMTLTSQCKRLSTLFFHFIGVALGLFFLHLSFKHCMPFLTTLLCNVGWILYCIGHALVVCFCTVKAIPGLLQSCRHNAAVDWSALEDLWQPPSAQAKITQNGGLWSLVAGTQQTSVTTTVNVNLGWITFAIAFLCYLVAAYIILHMLLLVCSQLEKILSQVYNGISYLVNCLAACSWVKKARSHISNGVTKAFTCVATQCCCFVSFVWKGLTKFGLYSMCVASVNLLNDVWRFNSNEVDALKEAEKLTTSNKHSNAAFRNVFCTFLIKVTTKATKAFGSVPLLGLPVVDMDKHLTRNIQNIRENQNGLNLDGTQLDTIFYSDPCFVSDHNQISEQLGGIDIKGEYAPALDAYRQNRSSSSVKRYKGIVTDFHQHANTICEDIKRKTTQLRYYEFFALVVFLLSLLGFGYIAYHQLQVEDQTFMDNSKAQEQVSLINDREMFLQTDKRQCFPLLGDKKQSVFNECMAPHLWGVYKQAYNDTISHFRKMDNANRTMCIETHKATEADKSFFWAAICGLFFECDIPEASAPIEHSCPILKEKDADLEKEKGFEHELKGRFYKHSWVPNFPSFHSRFCLINVSYDSAKVTEAYESPIAKALSTPDYGWSTFLTFAADMDTSIHYRTLGSVALKWTLMSLLPAMLLLSLVNWLLALAYNTSL